MKKRYSLIQATSQRLAPKGQLIRQLIDQDFARPSLGLLGLALWMTLMLQPTLTTAQCTGTITLSTQAQIDAFPTRGCTTLPGDLVITGSTITNLDGLSSLTSVESNLRIVNNPNLSSVAGLSGLTRVGNNLRITNNDILPNLDGLNNLTRVGGETGGDLRINNNPKLISVAGLSKLTRIGFDLQIIGNTILPNLTGLSSLTSIGGDLLIQTNPKLINVAGLNGLTRVVFNVQISGNDVLPNLTGLSNLTSIGGDLLIQTNPKLINVAGLSGLTGIGFDLRITGNAILASLTGFSSLISIGGDLRVLNNPQLSGCAIAAICQYLANPPAIISISGNATGCTSAADIQADCSPLSLSQPPASSSVVCVGTPVSTAVGMSGNDRFYQWYKDGLSLGAAQQSSILSLSSVQPSDAGTYRVVVSNSVTSLTSTAFSLTVSPYPTASLAADGQLTCAITSVTLIASGGEQGAGYRFKGPMSFSQTGFSSMALVSTGGPYSVTVTNPGGCSSTATTNVESITTTPTASLTPSSTITDTNPTVTLTASGGTSYSFSSGVTQQNGNTATVTTPGIYSVTVTGGNGCTATASTTVTGAASQTICRNGTAVIRVVAAGNPVKYEWYRNSITSARLVENPAQQKGTSTASLTLVYQGVTANYYVRVTDANGTAVVYGPFKVTVNLNCNVYGRVAAEEVALNVTLLGNPINGDQLRATVQGAAGKALTVQLLDLSGKTLRAQQWQQAESDQSVEWNLSGQASGVYLLQAATEADAASQSRYHTVKVVKP